MTEQPWRSGMWFDGWCTSVALFGDAVYSVAVGGSLFRDEGHGSGLYCYNT